MSLRVVYESRKTLRLASVQRALELAKEGSRSYEELWPLVHKLASLEERKALPDLYRLSHLRIDDICVTGRLDLGSGWEERWLEIIQQGKSLQRMPGSLVFSYSFQDRNCHYPGAAYGDDIGLWLQGDKVFFDVWKGADNMVYQRKVLGHLIERFDLPLVIEDIKDRKGHYLLKRALPGEMWIRAGQLDGEDASAFRCELPKVHYRHMVQKISGFLDDYASKRIETSWRVIPSSLSRSAERAADSQALYEALRRDPLPAEAYRIDVGFFVTALEGFDEVKSLVVNEKELPSHDLCKITTADKRRCGLGLLVGPKGCRLQFYSSKKEDKKDFPSTPMGKKFAAYL